MRLVRFNTILLLDNDSKRIEYKERIMYARLEYRFDGNFDWNVCQVYSVEQL